MHTGPRGLQSLEWTELIDAYYGGKMSGRQLLIAKKP